MLRKANSRHGAGAHRWVWGPVIAPSGKSEDGMIDCCSADLNRDGVLDFFDLSVFFIAYEAGAKSDDR